MVSFSCDCLIIFFLSYNKFSESSSKKFWILDLSDLNENWKSFLVVQKSNEMSTFGIKPSREENCEKSDQR